MPLLALLLIAFFVIAVSCWIGRILGNSNGRDSQFETDLLNFEAFLKVIPIHAEDTGQPIETVIKKVRSCLEEAAKQDPETAREMMSDLFVQLSRQSTVR